MALVIGISSAIYLSEYSRNGRLIRLIRIAILNLAGVPSIVFGLFGFGLFVIFFGWNVSLMAGWFTLGLMVLPAIITASEESLRAVPQGLREGSLALGATKWQTIRKNVLPYALPGILTSSILGIARVAGETAPIMFTAAYAMKDEMPWQVAALDRFLFPRRDGAALSHLCCQFEDSAERIHRARPIRRRLCFPLPRDADRADLDRLARTKQEPFIMVNLPKCLKPPHLPVLNQPEPISANRRPSAAMIEIEHLDFTYGNASGVARRQPAHSRAGGDRLHRAFGLRQNHAAPLLQPHERSHRWRADHARVRSGSKGSISTRPRSDVVDLRRRVGMVFQKSNPFPKSIYDNVAYGLRIAGVTKRSQIDEAVEKSLRAAALWDEVKDRLAS